MVWHGNNIIIEIRARFTQTRALFRKNVGPPRAPTGIFARGNQGSERRKSPSGVQGRIPGGGLGPKPPEADGLLKMTYTDIAFLIWGPHFCGGPCSAEHAGHA